MSSQIHVSEEPTASVIEADETHQTARSHITEDGLSSV